MKEGNKNGCFNDRAGAYCFFPLCRHMRKAAPTFKDNDHQFRGRGYRACFGGGDNGICGLRYSGGLYYGIYGGGVGGSRGGYDAGCYVSDLMLVWPIFERPRRFSALTKQYLYDKIKAAPYNDRICIAQSGGHCGVLSCCICMMSSAAGLPMLILLEIRNNYDMTNDNKKNTFDTSVIETVFPLVIADFTGWVLQKAAAMGIKRLYFLARDGYIINNTAANIAEKYGIETQLCYLYCSRLSLRNAALGELGEEAYRYLLEGGYAVTPKVILGRLRLDGKERERVYNDIGFTADENTEMGKAAASDLCGRLRSSEVYNEYVKAAAEGCKESAMAYLEQEGLLSDIPYAIVDSGWTGSMQRMLRVLTGRRQVGFYFGMYSKGREEDGEFYTYLFNKDTSPLLVSKFNNNLFEAVCSAPHGMTVGYEREGGRAVPVLKSGGSLNSGSELVLMQEKLIYDYAREKYVLPARESTAEERQRFAFPLLDRLMYKPDVKTAELYGSLRFSDDTAELNSFPMAAKAEDVKKLYFLPRLLDKLFKKGKPDRPAFWGYGTAVLSGKGRFCRLNLRLWELLWLIKRK